MLIHILYPNSMEGTSSQHRRCRANCRMLCVPYNAEHDDQKTPLEEAIKTPHPCVKDTVGLHVRAQSKDGGLRLEEINRKQYQTTLL